MLAKSGLSLLIALGLVAVLAGCSEGGAQAYAPPSPAPDLNKTEAVKADATFDVGHTVHVTSLGLRPQSLASLCCNPVVFKNETDHPISIVFDIYKWSSGTIAPGASWSWTPVHLQSLTYRLGNDLAIQGHIQLESPQW